MKVTNDIEAVLLTRNPTSENVVAAFEKVAAAYKFGMNPTLLRLELQQLKSFQRQKQIVASTGKRRRPKISQTKFRRSLMFND